MKKYRTMVIFLVIFIVLFGLYFFMKQMNKVREEKEQEETIMVTQVSNLISMEYTDGEQILSLKKEDGVWTIQDNAEIQINNDSVDAIAQVLCQIQAVRVLSGADELSSYGLEEPAYTVSLATELGSKVMLYIGDSTGEYYYATIGDKVVVYVIESSVVESLEFDITMLEAEEEVAETTESN